uniref:Signal recognition particle subunit SRP72 n=1 Tax=Heterorhabditis bacteriophora TaxID=37862 RepID=A0A1I7WBQ6_HETBA
MATESSGSLRQCLTDLVRADTSGDYQRALQSSNRSIIYKRNWLKICYYFLINFQQVDDGYETFEQLYNFACQEIESENLDSALIHLEKSLGMFDVFITNGGYIAIASYCVRHSLVYPELCRFTLAEEGLSEEEIDDELSMIRVQRAFVLHKMGRRQEALDVYKRVQNASPSDVSVVATVINNIPGASQEFNLPDSRKKFKIALQVDQNKLTYRQRRTLMLNNALVLLLSNQREPCRRALDDLIHRFGLSKDVCLIEAALFVKLNEVGKALKVLESGDTQMKMTCIHVMLNNGMMNEALNALNSLPNEIRSLPAVVSLVTSVLIALDRKEDALKVLESSISVTQDPEGLRYLLNQAAELEASNNNMAGSCKYLEKLSEWYENSEFLCLRYRLIPDDLSITCRLIRAYSEFNPKSAEVLSNQVFPETSDDTLDVDSLENNDWILYGEKYRQKKEAKMEIEDTEIITRKLKNIKRKRKIRLPKNYDPSIQPDPESIVRSRMKKCPQVIQEHKDERLCWAKIFMRCNWEKVRLLRVFNLDGPDGCHSYWRNLRKEPRHCSTRNFGGGSLMIWGTFSAMGLVDLAFVSTKMNSTGYQDACAHYLVPYLQRFPDVSFTLQQNNATIHASRNTKT